MTSLDPGVPAALPECRLDESAREVPSATRSAAVAMSDCATSMARSGAPASWRGDAAAVADHRLTQTGRRLDDAVSALRVGVAALERYVDVVEPLRGRYRRLRTRHATLTSACADLRRRATGLTAAGHPELAAEAARLRGQVADLDADLAGWSRALRAAEDTLITKLQSADTPAEAAQLPSSDADAAALAAQLKKHRGDPEAVKRWWDSLTRKQREALKIARPGLVGNLDGIPVRDRDESNRARLEGLAAVLAARKRDGEALSKRDQELGEQIQAVRTADRRRPNGSDAFLLLFDPDAAGGDGYAAVAYGDPDTADHVSVSVPGLTSRGSTAASVAADAAALWERSNGEGNGVVASIAWLGYDAPDHRRLTDLDLPDAAGVGVESKAAAGAENLTRFVDGLRATHEGEPAHLTVIGHSYGSTTVAKAAAGDMRADDVVLLGSPGAGGGNDHASDLHGRVHVGSADEDPVTRLGNSSRAGLGVDPASKEFGAHRFKVADGADLSTPGGILRAGDNHTSYYDENGDGPADDSHSLKNLGRIVAGRPEDVERDAGRTESNDDWWRRQPVDAVTDPLDSVRDRVGRGAERLGEALQPHARPVPWGSGHHLR